MSELSHVCGMSRTVQGVVSLACPAVSRLWHGPNVGRGCVSDCPLGSRSRLPYRKKREQLSERDPKANI